MWSVWPLWHRLLLVRRTWMRTWDLIADEFVSIIRLTKWNQDKRTPTNPNYHSNSIWNIDRHVKVHWVVTPSSHATLTCFLRYLANSGTCLALRIIIYRICSGGWWGGVVALLKWLVLDKMLETGVGKVIDSKDEVWRLCDFGYVDRGWIGLCCSLVYFLSYLLKVYQVCLFHLPFHSFIVDNWVLWPDTSLVNGMEDKTSIKGCKIGVTYEKRWGYLTLTTSPHTAWKKTDIRNQIYQRAPTITVGWVRGLQVNWCEQTVSAILRSLMSG